ncbi:MAG TPA: L-threonylcarbamoyladenylate synthase [Planctomycetota bacterium]|nr:L-threonylcarbamoyladenylate synthase [Planctomycetota bacterium]
MDDRTSVRKAVETLRNGGLVAFPTETVYGLGADADNAQAVQSIFRVKGRPERHPLIVHLASSDDIKNWAISIPDEAFLLIQTFWPGPLTLILKKTHRVLREVTGGQDTVGLRVPDHKLALGLLREFGGGVAAPSANRFGRVSPTSADHVRQDLGDDVDWILDGGSCAVGVESTIVDFSSGEPVILRPGGVTREALQETLRQSISVRGNTAVRVSGQHDSHYAPRALVVIVTPGTSALRAQELRAEGKRVVELRADEVAPNHLYASLRRADAGGAEVIVVPLPEETGLGLAVADRLRKAAGPRA